MKCAKCELCGSVKSLQTHHKFSQTKLNKKLYGDLLHSVYNTMTLCEKCHLWRAIPKLSELEFCQLVGIEPRSKTGKLIWDRLKGENSE